MQSPIQQVEQQLYDLRSPKRATTFWGLLAVMMVCSLMVLWIHRAWIFDPNAFMLGDGPDGFKNYMTTTWHVRHDEDFLHYDGMNHPFGEHVLFTDNQPLLSGLLQWWSRNVSDLSNSTVGIVNRFQAISIVLCSAFLFLLFRKLHFPVWYAGLAALAMTFLAPQYTRFDGHFGLSHIFIIPMLLYWLCRYEERVSRRYQSLHIGIGVCLAAQLHFYYFGLAIVFLTLYLLFQILRDFRWANIRARLSHWVVMLVLPYILLTVWLQLSDYAADRPASPYGFTDYIGRWEGVFLPYKEFGLYHWIDKMVKIRTISPEARAYAGVMALPFTLWLLLSRGRMFGFKWGRAAYHRTHRHFLRGILVAGALLLLFAFGFPFAIPGLEWLVEYMGPFKQFRGLGRFTWIYFYIINIVLLYGAWNVSVRYTGILGGKALWLRWPIALVPVVLLAWEAAILQKIKPVALLPNVTQRNIATDNNDTEHWLNVLDFKAFQALLPLPYYHEGSENIWLDLGDQQLFRKVQMTAVQTGVPDIGVYLSRTSAAQTLKSVQLALEPCTTPVLLQDLDDRRPIAVMVDARQWTQVQAMYPHLVRFAKPLYDQRDLKVFSLWPDSIRSGVRAVHQDMRAEANRAGQYRRGLWRASDATLPFYYQPFDSLTNTPQIFHGSGAFAGNTSENTTLWSGTLPQGDYTLSLWVYAEPNLDFNPWYTIEVQQANGQQRRTHEVLGRKLRAIADGWVLLEVPIRIADNEQNQPARFFLQQRYPYRPFFVDEVMLRANTLEVYRVELGRVAKNNVWYRE